MIVGKMAKNSGRIGEFEELILLAIHAAGKETAVVEVQESLRTDAGRRASMGAIYSALDRLERKRLTDSRLGEPTARRGGKRKRYYRLTPAAELALAELRSVRERLWSRAVGVSGKKS